MTRPLTLYWKVLDAKWTFRYHLRMASVRSIRQKASEPVPIQNHALDNLRYIRETMERSESFTAVPGWGGVTMGMTAVAASVIASWQTSSTAWLGTWIVEAVLALIIGLLAMHRKALAAGVEPWSGPARRFAASFTPPIVAGGALTIALWLNGMAHLVPGTWLMLYGTAVITGGAFSVRIVPMMGVCFVVAGAATLFAPFPWANVMLGICLGGLQIVFGAMIAKKYGG